MLAKSSAPIDFSTIPGSAVIIAAIDAILAAPWALHELRRRHVLVWANVGGYTLAKDRGLHSILFEGYRDTAGWNVQIEDTSDVSWTIYFDRRSG